MQKNVPTFDRKGFWLTLVVLGLLAVLVVVPNRFRSEAGQDKSEKKIYQAPSSHEEGLENYDIREDNSQKASDALAQFRQKNGKNAASVANERENFVLGEQALKQRVPHAKVEYNFDIKIPEVITPDVWRNKIEFLTDASGGSRVEKLKNFVKQNNLLVGVTDEQTEQLKVTADYTNPDGNLSFTHLEQRINDIPVFRGEVKAGFTKDGRIIRVINNLGPGLDYENLSKEFYNASDAVKAAAGHINYELLRSDVTKNNLESTDLRVKFGEGDWATIAEKMYFPTEPGIAVPAWRVTIWKGSGLYMVLVDAETGTLLWRKNGTEDQTQAATYQVYRNPNAMIDVADSPAPMSPGPINPTLGTQGLMISRSNVTLVGNEAPYTFNNNGWITDGTNITDGNAVEAGVDRDTTNGVDATQVGSPNRVFDSTWNPPPGNPAPGDDPLSTQAQRGAVIQMFYVMNRYHDELYRLGFTEAAGNFQQDNFGRGGLGADRVSAEGQDNTVGSSCPSAPCYNNANFSTPADGGRGRMQMYIWNGPTPDYDGTTDADIIIHEVTHGTSNRLHGNASGLSNNMSRGMGEGWSDFYAHALLSEPTDPLNGVYTTGGYATYLISSGFTGNYYYGIRRFPKAVIGFTGPNGKPHNPLTFRHLNSNCNTEIGTSTSIGTISAYPRGPVGSTTCDQVHAAGEVWSTALWEVRGKFVSRLGWAAGNRKALQLVTDGMKLAPIGPTFLSERDAIIAAAAASAAAPEASADVADVREGFRLRGMGFSAAITTVSTAVVVEAFDYPNVVMTNPFAVSDSTGDNDGYPEPGENILISVSVANTTGATVNNVRANINGGADVSFGNMADGATSTKQISYTVPADAACGSLHNVTINIASDVGPQSPQVRSFKLGAPLGGAPVTFSNNTVINLPNGQPGTTSGAASPYPADIIVSGLTGNKKIKVELTGVTHTYPGDLDFLLVGPGGQSFIMLSDSGGTGDVSNLTLTLSDDATAQPATSQWVAGNFLPTDITSGDTFTAPAPAGPYQSPPSVGTATFASVFGTAASGLNGTWSLYVMDDAGGDFGSMAGWKITFEANDFSCSINSAPKSRADFDGDGKSDVSVFRSSNNTWYLNRSTAGFTAMQFGSAGDIMTPDDYDGDGKADISVFRPSNGVWYRFNSSNGAFTTVQFGQSGDVPANGDFDGDGKADVAVFRPSNGTWYGLNSSNGAFSATQFGQSGDVPTNGDFDGDSKRDVAVFRPSNGTWYRLNSSNGAFSATQFGLSGDIATAADYDGDNKDDVAVFRPSNGTWYRLNSSNGAFSAMQFGQNGDVPAPGDFDGDGKDDQAVYRGGTWYLNQSGSGFLGVAFGIAGDTPLPGEYLQ